MCSQFVVPARQGEGLFGVVLIGRILGGIRGVSLSGRRGWRCSGLFRFVRVCSDLFGFVQGCSDLFRVVRICSGLFGVLEGDPAWMVASGVRGWLARGEVGIARTFVLLGVW